MNHKDSPYELALEKRLRLELEIMTRELVMFESKLFGTLYLWWVQDG
jgi:hypothetical protein